MDIRGALKTIWAELEDCLSCPICHDVIKDPRYLPCGHTFCLSCLEEYAGLKGWRKTVECCLCLRKSRMPPGGMTALPQNFRLKSIAERMERWQELAESGIKHDMDRHFGSEDGVAADSASSPGQSVRAKSSELSSKGSSPNRPGQGTTSDLEQDKNTVASSNEQFMEDGMTDNSIQIFIHDFSQSESRTYTISVCLTDSAEIMKRKLEQRGRWLPSTSRLLFCGKHLKGNIRLWEYGIQQNSTIDLF